MTTTNTTYRISINYKEKVILLSKPLESCDYFKDKTSYIDGTYTIFNKLVEIHKDPKQHRENHFIKSYKMAKILYNNLKKIKKSVFLHRFGLYFCHHSVTL